MYTVCCHSGLVGLDGLDAANYSGVAAKWRPCVRSSDSSLGVWRTCNQTTLWVVCSVLEAPQAG